MEYPRNFSAEAVRSSPVVQAADGCETEPIHIPGAIQPHGALLVAFADSLQVTHASENLASFLGHRAADVLGRPLVDAISVDAIETLLDREHGDAAPTGVTHVMAGRLARTWLQAHRCGRHVCIDIGSMQPDPPQGFPIARLQHVVQTFEHAAGAVELCEFAVHGLRSLSGYDRVMAYRFCEGGHGEVVAEARQSHLEPFLGLRYPASDIPPQARRLYLRQRVGAIADSGYLPVPLLVDAATDDGQPLDLTHSALRSVSPMHSEYMRNMGTAASLTVGLASGGELWGMLVCHHATPRIPGPELRAAAGTVGHVVSLMLASLGEAEVIAQRLQRNETLRALVDRLHGKVPLVEALVAGASDLLRLVNASGALLRVSGQTCCIGETPPRDAAEAALARLRETA